MRIKATFIITNVLKIKESTNAKIVAHEYEKEILLDKRKNLSASLPSNTVELDADIYVKDNDTLKVGDMKLKFIHTPGHTPGSMCIKIDKHMFTGDSLFAGCMAELIAFSFENKIQVSDKIVKVTKIEHNGKKEPLRGPLYLGVPNNVEVKRIVEKYYKEG